MSDAQVVVEALDESNHLFHGFERFWVSLEKLGHERSSQNLAESSDLSLLSGLTDFVIVCHFHVRSHMLFECHAHLGGITGEVKFVFMNSCVEVIIIKHLDPSFLECVNERWSGFFWDFDVFVEPFLCSVWSEFISDDLV